MSAPAEPRLSYEDIAGMMEHPVLQPELSEEAKYIPAAKSPAHYRIAAVTVRPSDADLAVVPWMRGSGIAVGSIVSYPHGSSSTSVKLYETRDLDTARRH